MFWKVLTVLNYGLPFSFLSGSFARGFLVFLSLKCFRAQILLRWLPLGMDLSLAQSEVRRPSPTLSGLPAPPSTAPSGSAGPSLVSSRSAASAASDLRALSARRPLQWALEPPTPLLLRNQEFRLESLSRTSLATMQNYLLTNLSATGVKDQKKILLVLKKLQKDQKKILLVSKKQKPIPSSTPVCINVWMYACTHVCMYVCIVYVCMYVFNGCVQVYV